MIVASRCQSQNIYVVSNSFLQDIYSFPVINKGSYFQNLFLCHLSLLTDITLTGRCSSTFSWGGGGVHINLLYPDFQVTGLISM